jgi:hypothetical protein
MRKPINISVPQRNVKNEEIKLSKKPWIGLSEADINKIKFNLPDLYYWVDVIRATEKRLKEKNNA